MANHQFTTISVDSMLDELCEVVDAARAAVVNHPRWLNAINTAWDFLLVTEAVEFDRQAHALRIESASDAGKVYVANGDCQCRAFAEGQACWHRAQARLVRRALERQAESAQRDMAELFPPKAA